MTIKVFISTNTLSAINFVCENDWVLKMSKMSILSPTKRGRRAENVEVIAKKKRGGGGYKQF